MLLLKEIKKNYGTTLALNAVSFTLKKGEVVGLLGPNGAGKSTLMKILTGIITQWEGNITYEDLDLRNQTKAIQQITGYLPENNPLYLDWYVGEYLQFVGALYNIKSPPLLTVMEKVGLVEVKHHKINTLSKGYQQRIGLAAALIHDPEIIILDEPTTGLDPNQMVGIRKLIRTLGKNKIVLLSTHILSEVESICDRVIIVNQGEVVADAYLEELRKGKQQTVVVTFDYRVETEALLKIDGVKQVVNRFDYQYEINGEGTEDIRPKIFDFAHDNQLKILSLQQKNETLAELFNDLTS